MPRPESTCSDVASPTRSRVEHVMQEESVQPALAALEATRLTPPGEIVPGPVVDTGTHDAVERVTGGRYTLRMHV